MTCEDLQTVVSWRPFVPFHIFLRGCTAFEVWRPERIVGGRHQALLGLAHDPQQIIFDDFAVVNLTEIENTELLSFDLGPELVPLTWPKPAEFKSLWQLLSIT